MFESGKLEEDEEKKCVFVLDIFKVGQYLLVWLTGGWPVKFLSGWENLYCTTCEAFKMFSLPNDKPPFPQLEERGKAKWLLQVSV